MPPDNTAPVTWTIHCDGSAVPNPGRMGLGAVLVAPDGLRHALSAVAPGRGCNNEAELRALIAALRAVQAHGATAVQCFTDSSVLVEQLTGPAARPIARLAPLFAEARSLLASFERVVLAWLPAHRNGESDALARAALGMAPRRVAVAKRTLRSDQRGTR